jgi:fibronectin-binding autotransporter adhesin
MKPKFTASRFSFCARTLLALVFTAGAHSTHAASASWSSTATTADWATGANWSAGAPGSTSALSTDIATFNTALVNGTIGGTTNPIVVDSGRRIGGISFGDSAGAYVIGSNAGNTLTLGTRGPGYNSSSSTVISSGAQASQVIAAPITFVQPSSTNGQYGFVNNATVDNAPNPAVTLSLTGNMTLSGARQVTVVLDGSNTGANTISGNVSFTSGTQGQPLFVKRGAGTWILSGSNTLSGTPATSTDSNFGVQVLDGVLSLRNNLALGSSAQVWIGNKTTTYVYNSTFTTSYTSTAGGTLELGNGITLDNGLTLNLFNGGTIRSSGNNTTNSIIKLNTATGTTATLSTVGSSDVFTVGNAANDLTGGASDTVIAVSGPGTVFLSQASNYAGSVSINSGTVKLGNATALGIASTAGVAFGANSTGRLALNGFSATIATLNSNATVGTPVIENNFAGAAVLTVSNTSGSSSFAGVLRDGDAGSLGLTKGGASTLILSGNNTYSGATTISGGLLKVNNVSNSSATGTGAVSVASGGTLGGAGFISGAVTVSNGGIIAPGNSVGTLTVGSLVLSAGSILNYEFNNTPANDFIDVKDSNGLTINGGGFNLYEEGTLNPFSSENTYSLIGYSGSIGGAGVTSLSVLNPQPGKAYTFGTTGSAVTLGIAASGLVSNWNVDSNGSWNTGGNWSAAVPNGEGETASFNFPLSAQRTVTLDGAKKVGSIIFDGGASPLGYTIASGSGGALSIDNGASQANIIVTTGANQISAGLSLDSDNTVASISGGSSLEVSGSISGDGSLVKSGAGSLDLTNSSNGYGGNTTVSGGTLGFSSLGSIGAGNLTIDGATLRYNAGNTADISGKVVTIGIGGAIINTNGNDLTYANGIGNGGSGNFIKSGGGVLTMQGNNTFTGTTTLNSGSLILGGTSATTGGTFINGANSLFAISSDGSLGAVPETSAVNLTLNPGSGNTATFRADNSFTINANRVISLASGSIVVDTNGNNLTIAGSLSGSAPLRKTGSGNLTLTGANSVTATGGITIDTGTVFVNDRSNLPGGSITLNGTSGISTGSAATNFSDVVVNGTNFIVKTGTNNILGLGNLSGGGTLTFGGAFVNDFTGNMSNFTGTIVANGGGSRWFGSTGGSNVTLDLANTGTSVRSGATGITLGAIAGDSTSTLTGSAGGVTQAVTYTIGAKTVGGLGVTAVDSVFDGAITNGAGTTSITKVGNSILTLNGTSTYTGATNVSVGTLLVNGALGNTAVTVANNAILGGDGTIGGNVNFLAGAKFLFSTTQTLDVAGAVTFGGFGIADLVGLDSSVEAGTYTLINGNVNFANVSNVGLANAFDLGGGKSAYLQQSSLQVVVIPEPSAALLGGLGLLALFRRRRNA